MLITICYTTHASNSRAPRDDASWLLHSLLHACYRLQVVPLSANIWHPRAESRATCTDPSKIAIRLRPGHNDFVAQFACPISPMFIQPGSSVPGLTRSMAPVHISPLLSGSMASSPCAQICSASYVSASIADPPVGRFTSASAAASASHSV